MNKEIQTPVLLLTGYLGAGKTTLLNRLLTNQQGLRIAVIVNDIGEINIDADLIARTGAVTTGTDGGLVPLQNGCICCTLQMDLVKQIADLLAKRTFDYIVIEASGICEPEPIARTICTMPQMMRQAGVTGEPVPRLDAIVTVVDALRLADEFGCGDDLDRAKAGDEDLANLLIQQIEFCNIVVINKISEVTEAQRAHIAAVVRALQPQARIIECDYGDVPLKDLLNTHAFDYQNTSAAATWVQELEKPITDQEEDEAHGHHHEHGHDHGHDHEHHHGEGEALEYGIQTMVYYRRAPFDLNRFDWLIDKRNWPRNIIRTKGVLYFDQNRDMSMLYEQAGRQHKLTQAGRWYATAPAEDIAALRQQDPDFDADFDPEYGDRMVRLVIIGQNLDREAITAKLDEALCVK